MAEETTNKPEKIVQNPRLKREFQTYVLWSSLPSLLRDLSDSDLEKFGFHDPLVIQLLRIRWQYEFANTFNVSMDQLTEWNRKIEAEGLADYKAWTRGLTRNVIMALYKTIIKEGKAAEVKLWLQAVEGWSEKTRLGVESEAKVELSPEVIAKADAIMRLAVERKGEQGE